MTYPVPIQQTEISSASATGTITLPSITTTSGNGLILAIYSAHTAGTAFSDGVIGNTYSPAGAAIEWTSGNRDLQIFYSQNINGGTTSIVVTGTTIYAAYAVEVPGLSTTSMFVAASAGNVQAGPGTTPTNNSINSGNVTNSGISALRFAFSMPTSTSVTATPTAGTSPIAFTALPPVWATINANATAPSIGEYSTALVNSTGAATFGDGPGDALEFNTMMTIAADFALAGGASSTAIISWIS